MKNTNKNRRQFISTLSKTAVAATLTQPVLAAAGTGKQPAISPNPAPEDFLPVKLTPLDADTEKKKPALAAPLNPSQQIGFAIVGLGHLSLEEILPAFGASKYARLVALVSGDKTKAAKVAKQYNVAMANVYDYTQFDEIKKNPAIQVVYVVLPNSMHEEFTIRAARAGKHVLCENR